MKIGLTGGAWLVALALAFTGCAKKTVEQASISGTGFDTLTSTEELAQLPQAGTATQQTGVEVLPVETSPITQSAIAQMPSPIGQAADALNYEQKIQAALKSAGFYTGNIDGKIGPASKRAIQAFQQSKGLSADGKVGPKTWAALEPYLTGVPTDQTATTEQ